MNGSKSIFRLTLSTVAIIIGVILITTYIKFDGSFQNFRIDISRLLSTTLDKSVFFIVVSSSTMSFVQHVIEELTKFTKMNRSKPIFRITLSTVATITGVILIATYIIFGGSFQNKKSSKKKIRKKNSLPGLINAGNTCFLNCILQALASSQSFTRWLELRTLNASPVLLNTLNNIIKILNNKTEDHVASPMDILGALRSHGWVISTEEQDAHELFHALTSTIDDEIKVLHQQSSSLLNVSWMALEHEKGDTEVNGYEVDNANHWVSSINSPSTDDVSELLPVKVSASKVERGTSIISKVPTSLHCSAASSVPFDSPFKGYLASQLTCNVCGYKNAEQWSTFESLSLFLPNSTWKFQEISLSELLEAFVRPECVTDVTCDGCTKLKGRPTQASFSKQLTVGKLPECLCIHIQRTVWLENGCAVKRKDFVTIPEVLNMEPFTYAVLVNQNRNKILLGGRPSNLKDTPSDSKTSVESFLASRFSSSQTESTVRWRSNALYRLQSVVVHVGDVFSGHFVTYRRGAINTENRERWFCTSDVVVKEVSIDEVLQSNAYMILYEKLTF